MPTNKHATIRFHALDRCFSNFGRKFYIEDLIEACNDALYELEGIDDGVKRRQIFDDIRFMESEQGWTIPLERHKDNRRVYYRYENKNFSIKNQGINQSEAEQLKETLSILSRFKGLPQFEWVEEMQIRLEDTFQLKGSTVTVVSFEQNPDLKGLNFFTDLFNAIQNQTALQVTYKSFKEQEARNFIFHPWHLKQFNNRWFVFGWNDVEQTLSNLAIDRIITAEHNATPYKENKDINFDEYFDDVLGVTVDPNMSVEKVLLTINKDLWPYIESKPIYGWQKIKEKTEDSVTIELNIQINYELRSLLFSFMDGVEVLEPQWLREEFKEKFRRVLEKYL
jgi:predicted DNA-binding transcriptional regulator YafY